MDTAKFIAFEGGDGAGKTTQAGRLHDWLRAQSISCKLVREPGGTDLGDHLRKYLKSSQPLTPEAELLLFAAARVELVTSQIRPALEAGQVVLADRFSASTVAYQGYGRGIDLGLITALNGFATQGIKPNVIFLLDLEPAVGLRRTINRQLGFSGGLAPLRRDDEGRRFEDLALEFHEKARQGFLGQARANPEHWVVIDGARPAEEVSEEVARHVQRRLGLLRAAAHPNPGNGELVQQQLGLLPQLGANHHPDKPAAS